MLCMICIIFAKTVVECEYYTYANYKYLNYRIGSIIVGFDLVYDSPNAKFEESLVQASADLALGSKFTYNGISVAAKAGCWLKTSNIVKLISLIKTVYQSINS